MKEEKLIHHSYSAYFNDENHNSYSLFHNCFHSYEVMNWLIKNQLCKTINDGQKIFQVLEELKIIHHGKRYIISEEIFLLGIKPNKHFLHLLNLYEKQKQIIR